MVSELLNIEKIKAGEILTLILGQSGCGKSILMKELIRYCQSSNLGGMILFDSENEYSNLFTETLVIRSKLEINELTESLESTIINGNKIRLDFSNCDVLERESYFNTILEIINKNSRLISVPFQIFIDSIEAYIGRFNNKDARQHLIRMLQMSRHRLMSIFTISQSARKINNDLLCEFNSFFVGKTSNESDIDKNALVLGLKKDHLKNCLQYQFIFYDVNNKNLPIKINKIKLDTESKND